MLQLGTCRLVSLCVLTPMLFPIAMTAKQGQQHDIHAEERLPPSGTTRGCNGGYKLIWQDFVIIDKNRQDPCRKERIKQGM